MVIDIFSRQVVGWPLLEDMTSTIVCSASTLKPSVKP
jgi:hypothetical protein